MIALFDLYKDETEGRSGVDAFLKLDGKTVPFLPEGVSVSCEKWSFQTFGSGCRSDSGLPRIVEIRRSCISNTRTNREFCLTSGCLSSCIKRCKCIKKSIMGESRKADCG